MDFISLFLTAMVMHRKIQKGRILISSCLGGVYGIFDIIVDLNPIIQILISITVSFLICIICFREKKISSFLIMFAMFWGVSALLGGFMSLLYSAFNKIFYEYIKDYSYSEVYNGARFVIIASIAIIASSVFSKMLIKRTSIKATELIVETDSGHYVLSGLVDSGNLLTEPLTGKCVILVSDNGKLGEVYNIGGHNEKQNIEIVKLILKELGKSESLIKFVKDRLGHDRRYAIDSTKITEELGWKPKYTFETGIVETIHWYLDNQDWMEKVKSGEYQEYYEKMYSKK
jgi:sigma-E processing peptidase SpoIIGA